MNFLQFLQSSSGENSSKRLAFLFSMFTGCFLVDSTVTKLINSGNVDLALDLVQSFLGFVLFLGGFVTAELLVKIAEIYKFIKLKK